MELERLDQASPRSPRAARRASASARVTADSMARAARMTRGRTRTRTMSQAGEPLGPYAVDYTQDHVGIEGTQMLPPSMACMALMLLGREGV
jgi:hypothetical protein